MAFEFVISYQSNSTKDTMSAKITSGKPRGEIGELTASLQSLCTMGKRSDQELRAQKREVFKKVVHYLTIGMDMSTLFASMTSCANLSPDDMVLKKMLYLYITHYATQAPDLALMTINQLHKDCVDQDPMVRGLALRSLCSLRVANYMEYVVSPVTSGLEDRNPYVRRTAVMGVLKLYHIDSDTVRNTGLLEQVQGMLHTELDSQVLGNCLAVMIEVKGAKKIVDKILLYNLLNRIKEFSDWSQCQVIELAAAYEPASEAEVYDMLNALEDRLTVPNSAVVLATTKAFLHFTLGMPAIHQQVLERLREPLKSLISRDDPATAYAVLAHVLLLAKRAPIIFENEHAAFYCRAHDPWYIKRIKMEILSEIAVTSNVYDIVTELTEYTRDVVHPNMAREAVKAVGRIALQVPDMGGIVERLLLFLDSHCEDVVAETLVQMKDLLRRYPDMAEVCISQVHWQDALTPAMLGGADAKAAAVWIIGQFGQHVSDAPYLLEPLVQGFATEDVRVRHALLTATAQLFFKRPPECHKLLGAALRAGVADSLQDVRDRSLFYIRLLQANIAEATRIISPPLLAVTNFSEALSPEMKEQVFKEFNSFSVIFQAPSSTFLDEQPGYHTLDDESAAKEAPGVLIDNSTNLLADLDEEARPSPAAAGNSSTPSGSARPANGGPLDLDSLLMGDGGASNSVQAAHTAAPPAAAQSGGGGLLDFGGGAMEGGLGLGGGTASSGGKGSSGGGMEDLLGGLGGDAHPAQTGGQRGADVGAPGPVLVLRPQGTLSPTDFMTMWTSLPVAHSKASMLNPETVAALVANNHQDFTAHMQQAYIINLASGGSHPSYKYFFYGMSQSHGAFLVEFTVDATKLSAVTTIKAQHQQAGSSVLAQESASLVEQFAELWGNCLMGFFR